MSRMGRGVSVFIWSKARRLRLGRSVLGLGFVRHPMGQSGRVVVGAAEDSRAVWRRSEIDRRRRGDAVGTYHNTVARRRSFPASMQNGSRGGAAIRAPACVHLAHFRGCDIANAAPRPARLAADRSVPPRSPPRRHTPVVTSAQPRAQLSARAISHARFRSSAPKSDIAIAVSICLSEWSRDRYRYVP